MPITLSQPRVAPKDPFGAAQPQERVANRQQLCGKALANFVGPDRNDLGHLRGQQPQLLLDVGAVVSICLIASAAIRRVSSSGSSSALRSSGIMDFAAGPI
ncbi:hypothetical protein CA54_47650 [Symmachiella macrocystis]|uniref:Uncharacterized protein n=1 Tax=Symmachiella macrocystis TaxID=2527985 RepID=A0A5C6BBS5_9PLAN|nr:hypothetical protein CA54_47650 [Symmachiella macrocystis]